ncbi:Transcription factor TRY [Camellia lanceoleosa]|uniref:Transcription factor TRY n=1 Tax=Camellia lanceoleosa TaxID=1840588 RepID=A0ACC0H0K6_9ERIC|nr:Transcription factor TRY [Camellia lanceoleosa]
MGGAEVSSKEWDFRNMTEQEEDLIYRMYTLVGERWDLIAGRIPGRKPEEIERFWIMKHTMKGLPQEENSPIKKEHS